MIKGVTVPNVNRRTHRAPKIGAQNLGRNPDHEEEDKYELTVDDHIRPDERNSVAALLLISLILFQHTEPHSLAISAIEDK